MKLNIIEDTLRIFDDFDKKNYVLYLLFAIIAFFLLLIFFPK